MEFTTRRDDRITDRESVLQGTVLSAYKGCRVKLRLTDGRIWFVPPVMLRRVANVPCGAA